MLRRCPTLAVVLLAACTTLAPDADPPPLARETGVVESRDGARIYYEVAGTGSAMLFIHGLAGNHAAWFQQVPYFARTRRVVTLSQRGFAPSTAVDDTFDVDRLVADAASVIDRVGARDIVVVGQSMGGWTALGLALARPDLVRVVVLSDTTAGIVDDEIAQNYETVTKRAREIAGRPLPLASHPAIGQRFAQEHRDLAYLYQLLTSFGSPNPGGIAQSLGRARLDDARLRALRARVLFVVGEKDPIFPPAIVRRAASHLAGAEVVVIDDAGHSPYFERPDAWNAAVEAFLDQ